MGVLKHSNVWTSTAGSSDSGHREVPCAEEMAGDSRSEGKAKG